MRYFRAALWAALAISAALLAARACIGPHALVRSPMNAEAIVALSTLFLLATRRVDGPPPTVFAIPANLCVATILAAVMLAFWPTLSIPLLHDDYAHLAVVREAGPDFWMNQLTVPAADPFFRPLGMYTFRLDTILADRNAVWMRLENLLFHAANCILIFFIGRRMGLVNWTALFAALLFGWHGSRPESVGWVAARFDVLAVFFLLGAFLLLYRYVERPSGSTLATAALMALAALLSKESAYVMPLQATLLFWRKLPNRVLAGFYALTALVFLHRWRLLGGIGGYRSQAGEPTIFIVSALQSTKALFLRLWATLWFPINWSDQPRLALAVATTCMLAAVLWLTWNRAALNWRALAFVYIAALPVQHLLLIGADLEKSRVLYLPSVGFALLAGFAIQSVPRVRGAAVAGVLLLLFQLAALQHNFRIWSSVTALGMSGCTQVGETIRRTDRDALLLHPPNVVDGVYFLAQGFAQCVEWHTGIPWRRVQTVDRIEDAGDLAGRLLFVWDDQQERLTEVP